MTDIAVPPPPAITDLSVIPITPWDSFQVAIAAALQSGTSIEVLTLRDRLMKMPTPPDDSANALGHDAFPGPSRAVRLYLLGELAAKMNDARGLQSATDTLLGPGMAMAVIVRRPSSFGMTLQSLALINQGDTTRALEWLEKVLKNIPDPQYPYLWLGASADRQRRIEWLRATGQDARADSLMTSVTDYGADRMTRRDQ